MNQFCQFCTEFSAPRTLRSRIIWENDNLLLLPTIGCFQPGYCLLMPRKHRRSFAALGEDEMAEAESWIRTSRSRIETRYGTTIVAEHGPGECDMGASCCDHAHLHFIPLPGLTEPLISVYQKLGGPPKILSSLMDLRHFNGQPYLLLSPQDGVHMVWTNVEPFRRQFVRWAAAKLLGLENFYNWRNYHFAPMMLITKRALEESDVRACA